MAAGILPRAALPAAVLGPVLARALRRLALILRALIAPSRTGSVGEAAASPALSPSPGISPAMRGSVPAEPAT